MTGGCGTGRFVTELGRQLPPYWKARTSRRASRNLDVRGVHAKRCAAEEFVFCAVDGSTVTDLNDDKDLRSVGTRKQGARSVKVINSGHHFEVRKYYKRHFRSVPS